MALFNTTQRSTIIEVRLFTRKPYSAQLMSSPERLLGDDSSRDDAFTLAAGRLFLVEAKRQGEVTNISQYMPEAVSQAVALCEITKHVLY